MIDYWYTVCDVCTPSFLLHFIQFAENPISFGWIKDFFLIRLQGSHHMNEEWKKYVVPNQMIKSQNSWNYKISNFLKRIFVVLARGILWNETWTDKAHSNAIRNLFAKRVHLCSRLPPGFDLIQVWPAHLPYNILTW